MLKKIIYSTLALLVLLITAIAIALQTEPVQQWIDVEIKQQVREQTGWDISYAHFIWEFPFRLTLTDIVLDDRNGTQVKIAHASGTVNPIAALRKYILIHDLDVQYEEWNIVGTIRGSPENNSFKATLTITSNEDPNALLLIKTRIRDFEGPLELSGNWHEFKGQVKGMISWDGKLAKYSQLSGRVEDYELGGTIAVDSQLHFDGTQITLNHPEGNGLFILSGTYETLRSHFDLTVPVYKDLHQIHLKGDLSHLDGKIDTQFAASFSLANNRYYTDTSLVWSPYTPLQLRTNGRDDKGMLFDGEFFLNKEQGYNLIVRMEHGTFFNELVLNAILPKNESKWTYTLLTIGDNFKADMNGSAAIDMDSQTIEVAELKGTWKNHQISLEDPFTLEHTSDQLKLSPLFLSLDAGTIYTTFDYIGTNVHIAARLVDLPLSLLPMLEEDFTPEATFNGNFFIFGPVNHLGGQAQLELPKIVISNSTLTNLPVLEGKINANLMNDTLELSGNFSGISTTPISLEASIPMILSFDPFLIEVHVDKPFTTKLNYDGPVGPITELITTETAPLKGDLLLQIELTGSMRNPQVVGSGTFSNGSYESVDTGVIYQNISARFDAKGDHIDITQIHASDSNEGVISGTGTLKTSVEQKFPFNFDLDVANARLVRIDWIKSRGTGKINFQGDLTHAKLSGTLEANGLKVTIPERRNANIKTIPITYINQSQDEPPPTVVTRLPFNWPIDLDVFVETSKGVVSGDDFNTSWRGKMTAKGTLQDPELEGKVRIIDGSYLFNGRPFEITQGSITFAGDPLRGTNLYVVAEQDLGEITAEVVLKGTLDNPELSLRSKPPLPQREVLSWILFGRGTSEINSIEKQELTKSIADLNTGGRKDVLTRLRQQIGIDRIDINRDMTGETNEMSIQVGKYISRGVLVSVNKNINNDANRIGIEAKLTHNIKVEAEVGDNAEGHLFLKWKKDY